MGGNQSTRRFADGINKLRTDTVAINDHETWALIFGSEVDKHTAFSMVEPIMIRTLRRDKPHVLATVLFKCIDQLHLFTQTTKDKGRHAAPDVTPVRNALLLLARLVPYALESHPMYSQVLDNPAAGVPATPSTFAAEFFKHVFEENSMCAASGEAFPSLVEGRTLGDALVLGIFGVSMSKHYGIGPASGAKNDEWRYDTQPDVLPARLWCDGIGNPDRVWRTSHRVLWTNRIHILMAVRSLFAGQAYSENVFVRDSLRQTFLDPKTPGACTFAASVLNQLAYYDPEGSYPYSSYWTDEREELVRLCAEVSLLGLDSWCFHNRTAIQSTRVIASVKRSDQDEGASSPDRSAGDASRRVAEVSDVRRHRDSAAARDEREDGSGDEGDDVASNGTKREPLTHEDSGVTALDDEVPGASKSNFWSIIANARPEEFKPLLRSLVGYMRNIVGTRNTYLPGSQRLMPEYELFFSLFWTLIARSTTARKTFASDHALSRNVVVPLFTFGFQGVSPANRSPQTQLAISTLAALSVEREFVIALNHPFAEWVPFDVQPFQGTYSDLLIIGLHQFILCREPWVRPQHGVAVAIFANISGFVTSVCPTAAVRFGALLDVFSNPAWLKLHGSHPKMLENLIIAIARFLQYQYHGSATVLYTLVRDPRVVKKMLTVARLGPEVGLRQDYERDSHVFTIARAVEEGERQLMEAQSVDPSLVVERFFQGITLVGKLPVPQLILLLQFPPTAATDAWRASWVWSLIFINTFPPFIAADCVHLFDTGVAQYLQRINQDQQRRLEEGQQQKQSGKGASDEGDAAGAATLPTQSTDEEVGAAA